MSSELLNNLIQSAHAWSHIMSDLTNTQFSTHDSDVVQFLIIHMVYIMMCIMVSIILFMFLFSHGRRGSALDKFKGFEKKEVIPVEEKKAL